MKYEATALRSRLESALKLVDHAARQVRVTALQGERNLEAELSAMLEKLPEASSSKETERKRAIEETAAHDGPDGLLYLNLKALVTAGRDHFTVLGDLATASLFGLDVLHRAPAAAPAEKPAEPVA